jgi:hypothetical protein
MERPTLTSLRFPYRSGPSSEKMNLCRNQFTYSLNQLFRVYNRQALAVDEDMAKNLDHDQTYTDSPYHPFPPEDGPGNPIRIKLNSETVTMTFEKFNLISIGYKNLRDQIDSLTRSL